MLLADDKGAELIVAVGTHDGLVDFLDKGRAGMASTFLTRLRVSDKLVDAKGVSRLYRQRICTLQVVLLAVAGLVALGGGAGRDDRRPDLLRPPRRPHRRDRVLGHRARSPIPGPKPSRHLVRWLLTMIDFRYHLVSLISVFLALAVGIVLGAGPLKEPIARGLSQSVQQLRQDRDSLRRPAEDGAGRASRTATRSSRRSSRSSSPTSSAGAASSLVTLPGVDADAVAPAHDKPLAAAGAKVTGRVDVQNAWVDPADARRPGEGGRGPRRGRGRPGRGDADAARPPGTAVGRRSPDAVAAGPAGVDPGHLAVAAAGSRRAGHDRAVGQREDRTTTRAAAARRAAQAGLIDVNGDAPTRATQAVVLAPGWRRRSRARDPVPRAGHRPDARLADAGAGPRLRLARARWSWARRPSATPAGSSPPSAPTQPAGRRRRPSTPGARRWVTSRPCSRCASSSWAGAGSYGFGDGAKAPLPARAAGGPAGAAGAGPAVWGRRPARALPGRRVRRRHARRTRPGWRGAAARARHGSRAARAAARPPGGRRAGSGPTTAASRSPCSRGRRFAAGPCAALVWHRPAGAAAGGRRRRRRRGRRASASLDDLAERRHAARGCAGTSARCAGAR